MHELPSGTADEALYKSWFYSLHKTLGVAVLLIAIVRIAWAAIQPHPRPLNGDRKLEVFAARTVHWMLYGAIILMPLTGWLHHSAAEGFAPIWWPFSQDLPLVPKDPQLSSLFGFAHFFTAILLGLSLVLHVGGALKHILIDRDGTLSRMIPGKPPDIPANLPKPDSRNGPLILAAMAFLLLGAVSFAGYKINGLATGQSPIALTSTTGSVAGWSVDHVKSRLDIQIVQSGSPVTGSFSNWDATINFDPDNLGSSDIRVEIDIASLSLGGVSEQAISADFLNAGEHPVGNFASNKVVGTGEGTFEAHGQLTLAGRSKPIILPFDLTIVDDRAFVEGRVVIERLSFDIGRKGFSSDEVVGFEVAVSVVLEAEKTATH